MKISTALGTAVVALAAQLAPSVAHAEVYQQNASGTCQGSLPVFENSLRYRPLALANVSSSNVFVTCTSENRLGNELTEYAVYVHNTGSATGAVDCNFIPGRDSFARDKFPKSVILAPGQQAILVWTAANDNGGQNFRDLGNLSCSLPAGVEIEYISHTTVGNK